LMQVANLSSLASHLPLELGGKGERKGDPVLSSGGLMETVFSGHKELHPPALESPENLCQGGRGGAWVESRGQFWVGGSSMGTQSPSCSDRAAWDGKSRRWRGT
jgi:hypothetical protein